MSRDRSTARTAALVAGAVLVALAPQAGEADCRDLGQMAENFLQTYPTGGPLERFRGDGGRRVIKNLAVDVEGPEVAFLYSGDGPVTGARGRYLYMVLDGQDCILGQDWIDGATYDRVVPRD